MTTVKLNSLLAAAHFHWRRGGEREQTDDGEAAAGGVRPAASLMRCTDESLAVSPLVSFPGRFPVQCCDLQKKKKKKIPEAEARWNARKRRSRVASVPLGDKERLLHADS